MIFKNRSEAGKRLAQEIAKRYLPEDVVIYAIPRGGALVAVDVCKKLKVQMNLVFVRKIGHPDSPEYAIGAITENNSYFNEEILKSIPPEYLKQEIKTQLQEIQRRKSIYIPKDFRQESCDNKTAILIDDGVATGLDMKAAITEIKINYTPKEIVVAVPVIPKETLLELEKEFKVKMISLHSPTTFNGSIGSYYKDFSQVTDQEVLDSINLCHRKIERECTQK